MGSLSITRKVYFDQWLVLVRQSNMCFPNAKALSPFICLVTSLGFFQFLTYRTFTWLNWTVRNRVNRMAIFILPHISIVRAGSFTDSRSIKCSSSKNSSGQSGINTISECCHINNTIKNDKISSRAFWKIKHKMIRLKYQIMDQTKFRVCSIGKSKFFFRKLCFVSTGFLFLTLILMKLEAGHF